jgi:hypothetical protein
MTSVIDTLASSALHLQSLGKFKAAAKKLDRACEYWAERERRRAAGE